MKTPIVIKLGGSIVSPDLETLFNFEYLTQLRKVLEKHFDKYSFFIVLGGGALMRKYRSLAMKNGLTDANELHKIGTTLNVLHAEIVRAFYHDIADDDIFKYDDYYDDKKVEIQKNIKVGGGGRPGHSGDMDAVLGAIKLNCKSIISLKNIDGVYSKDPTKHNDTVRLDSVTWSDYLDIIKVDTHEPGGNYPVDPVTSRLALKHDIQFKICAGLNLDNLEKLLNNGDFVGTTIY